MSVADDFLTFEADEAVRRLLLNAMHPEAAAMQAFTFNVYNVRIDLHAGVAVVEDELNVRRSEEMSLQVFRRKLEAMTETERHR